MKKLYSFKLLLFVFCISFLNSADAQYSNATFNGAWFMHSLPMSPYGDSLNYLIFDGNGNILDGNMFPSPTTGNYSVNASGAFSGSLVIGGGSSFPIGGQFVSQNTATMGGYILSRVTNQGELMDTLTGTISTVNCSSVSISLVINNSGQIINSTGLITPVSGRVYADSSVFIGHIVTGSPSNSHWNEFSIVGYYANDTLRGQAMLDASPGFCGGGNTTTFLVRTGVGAPSFFTSSASKQNKLSVFPIPSHGVFNFRSIETIKAISISNFIGQEVYSSGCDNKNVSLDLNHLENGIYLYTVKTQSGDFLSGKIFLQK